MPDFLFDHTKSHSYDINNMQESCIMKKTFLAIAIAAGVAAPFAANADDAKVYGKVHMSFGVVDTGSAGNSNWQVRSHASRLGFKGSEDLGDGMSAIYKLEYQVNPDYSQGDQGSATNLKRRNQYIGLKGGFGEVRVGRHDTPLKMAQGKFDQFNDTDADIKGKLGISQGENRVDNVIAYLNKFGDITLGVALVPSEGDGTTAGDGPADTISAAVMYSNGDMFGSIAIDSYDDTGKTSASPTYNKSLMRAVGTMNMGTMSFGLLYEQSTTDGVGAVDDNNDKTDLGVSFGMKMGNGKVKAQFMSGNVDNGAQTTQTSLGYDYKLGKKTKVYAMWTDGTKENDAGATIQEYTFTGVGMVKKF